LLDGFAANGQAELRRDFAGPVAVKTMIAALGLEEAPVVAVLGWYDAIVEAVTRVTAGEPVSQAGRAAFATLRDNLLPALKRQPDSSLLAAASGLAAGLSDDQIVSNAAVLLFGGIETTEGMIANAFYFLLTNPDALSRVRADSALIPAVVEETLRLEPAASVVDRYAVRDVSLGGASIRAGDLVRVSLTGANRDPAIFADPDRFDPLRPNLRSHVTFAQGPHVCLGLHLARLEAHEALEQALRRLPHLELVASIAATQAAQPRGLVFRKPQALHVKWRV
jgi:cytochrome P450